MPIPILIAGAILAGAGAHINAKSKNDEAEEIIEKARKKYNTKKKKVEKKEEKLKLSLVDLGNTKKEVLDTSINSFLTSYSKIKNIKLRETQGMRESFDFTFDDGDVLQIQELESCFSEAASSATSGAALGAVIGLATSGVAGIVAGDLAVAGVFLSMGEVGAAASIAGTSIFGALSFTPLSCIAAPAVLISGIRSNMKADENLEKAEQTKAEVDLAVEKMKTSEVMLEAIEKKTKMFNALLVEVNKMFAIKVNELNDRISEIEREHGRVTAEVVSDKDIELFAVSRAMAGAVKAIIDQPLLNSKGEIDDGVDKIASRINGVVDNKIIVEDYLEELNYNDFDIDYEGHWNFIDRYGKDCKSVAFQHFVKEDNYYTSRGIGFSSKYKEIIEEYGPKEKCMITDLNKDIFYRIAVENPGEYTEMEETIQKAKMKLVYSYGNYSLNFYFNGNYKLLSIGYTNYCK